MPLGMFTRTRTPRTHPRIHAKSARPHARTAARPATNLATAWLAMLLIGDPSGDGRRQLAADLANMV